VVDRHVHVLSEIEEGRGGVRNFSDRTKSDEDADFLFEIGLESGHGSSVIHLSCSLGMANISVLLDTSLRGHVIENGRNIILSHLLPVESPELLLILVGVVLDVLATVRVTTRVSKPHIISSSSSDKGRGYFGVVHGPAVSGIENTVL